MSNVNPYLPPDAGIERAASVVRVYDPALDGLRGWLILVGIGVGLNPFVFGRHVIDLSTQLWIKGGLAAMTSAANLQNDQLFQFLVVAEIVCAAVIFLVSLIMVPLFLSKSRLFPKWFIGLHIAIFGIVIADTYGVHLLGPDLSAFDQPAVIECFKSLFGLCVWPYMLVSTRVASTFRR